MKVLVLCAILAFSGRLAKAGGPPPDRCEVTEAAIAELEELKTLVNKLTVLVETIIGSPLPEPAFTIINPELTLTWKRATLTWTPPEGVIGYTATLITPEGIQPVIRLSSFAESFTTTGITVGEEYIIKITPIKGDGPGETFISEVFVPVCPMICTFEYRPQCGTDGNTYSNPCALEIAQCEGSDETLELAYVGTCDPCVLVQCEPPICPDGFVIGSTPLPGECCVGCVDACAGIICTDPICDVGYVAGNVEGDCCLGCILEVYSDCSEAMINGKTSGTYMIQPVGAPAPFEAVCDMSTDSGGWTVILVRDGPGGNFYRDMADYVAGFGDIAGSFWLGLENLYLLNKQGNTEMLIQVTDQSGTSDVSQYKNFRINNADTDYTLETVAGFKGGAGNALFYNKGAAFSARDRDNDNSVRDCATELVGGWWYRGGMCSRANPLGEYRSRENFELEKGIFWAPFRGKTHSLLYLTMKIREPTA